MKILLLTYYWPPCGGAAVQRWLRLGSELTGLGHEITVVTTRNGDYPQVDPALQDQVPPAIRVVRTITPTFGGWFTLLAGRKQTIPFGTLKPAENDSPLKRALLWVRRNLVVPDARVIWNPFAYRAALSELRKNRHDLLITSGPPHSTHLVGYRLHKERGVPWIADFRDPWTTIVYLVQSPPWKPVLRLLQDLERRVCADADAITTVSRAISDELPPGNKHVVRNGFRPQEFAGLERHPGNLFRIKYIGTMTGGRDLTPVLEAVERLSAEGFPLSLHFIGTFPHLPTEWPGQYPHIRFHNRPFISHREALAESVDAEALLLLINRYSGSAGYLTMKLFEYLGAGTPVLGVGPVDCEAAEVLRDYRAGTMTDYEDAEGLERTIRDRVEQWQRGEWRPDDMDLSALTASGLAAQIVGIGEQITKKQRR